MTKPDAAAREPSETWEILRDPARADWPGVLVVSGDRQTILPVATGEPVNFRDSLTLAERIVAALVPSPAGGTPSPCR